ncbi:MAG TPA: VWA domain-containing protein [Terracidiphilus sp.]
MSAPAVLNHVTMIHVARGESMFQQEKLSTATKTHLDQFRTLRLFLLLSIVVPASLANCQAPQQPPDQAADASANVDQISFDLVAHDKKGRPVLDLKPAEIALTDGDSPVTVRSLRLVTGNQEGEHLVTLVFERPPRAAGARAGVDASWLKSERETAGKLLKLISESGYSVSVLGVESRLRLLQQFTSDRNAVLEAVKAATGPAPPWSGSPLSEPEKALNTVARTGVDATGKPVSANDRALAKTLYSALTNSGRFAKDQHMRPSLASLLALLQSQEKMAHRKAVILFTSPHDRPIDSSAKNAIQSIIGTANRAGVSIYVVNLNSADGDSGRRWAGAQVAASAMSQAVGPRSTSDPSTFTEDMQSSARQMQTEGPNPSLKQSDLRRLAEDTGGSYGSEKDIRNSTKQMIQDMTAYYEAIYPSPLKEYDGKFRPVVVKPLRRGLKIRSRTGYISEPPGAGDGAAPQPFELPLLKILSLHEFPVDVNFRAAILRIGDTQDGSVNVVAIEVPLSSLEIRSDSITNLSLAHISIVANIVDNTGVVLDHFSADIPDRGVLRDSDTLKYEAISLQRHFTVPPGHYVLETAVMDRNSNNAGARRIPFEVPTAPAALSLSDVIVARAPEPILAGDDPSDPLLYGDERVVPDLSGQLRPGAKNVSVFFVVHSDPHAPQATTVNLQVLRNGKLLGGAPVNTQSSAESEFSSYLTTFSVNPPVNGLYEVRAVLSQGGNTSQARATFTLTGAPAAGTDAVASEIASTEPLKILAPSAGLHTITFTLNAIQHPAPQEINSILSDAAKLAMNYRDSLPNFSCEKVTSRSVGLHGSAQLQHRDAFTEFLTYVDHEEHRTLLEHEQVGQKFNTDRGSVQGVESFGEFGSVIASLFRPSSHTDFQWKQAGLLGEAAVQVFDYRVARENSIFRLRASAEQVATLGFHGQVFIDSATMSVRRITEVADDVPKDFLIHAASVSVDYDYVAINNHDYMLPVDAQVILRMGATRLISMRLSFATSAGSAPM